MGILTKPENGPGRPPAAPRGRIRTAGAAGLGVPVRIKKKEGGGIPVQYHGVEKHLTNKQSLQNGVMPVAVGLRLGELVVHRCGSREA